MVFTQLATRFVVKPGEPLSLEVQAAGNCGAPLRTGLMRATFDAGSQPVPLTALQDGRWSATWTPAAAGNRPVTGRTGADIRR